MAPPLTKPEIIGVVIMAVAVALAYILIILTGEIEARRATAAWPPHATQERSSK